MSHGAKQAKSVQHILRSQQFSRAKLEALFQRTTQIQKAMQQPDQREKLRRSLVGHLVFTLFYEPSTRTRISFESAAHHLGMDVVSTENAREFSSAIKGETIEDTIRVLEGYLPSVIVMRHHQEGAAEKAAQISKVPIINAGDGKGQHPTQALLDLYTIKRRLGAIDGINVVVGGDLANGRTVRSLAYLLTKFSGVSLTFVSPPELKIGEDIKQYLAEKNVPFKEEKELSRVLPGADVVYWTRIQKERLADPAIYAQVRDLYLIGQAELDLLKDEAIIMHPLPRVNEIKTEVDRDARAAYFEQAHNGMYVRMAVLEMLVLGGY